MIKKDQPGSSKNLDRFVLEIDGIFVTQRWHNFCQLYLRITSLSTEPSLTFHKNLGPHFFIIYL